MPEKTNQTVGPRPARRIASCRSFNFGGLLSLHMLDTRLIGRDKQIGFAELLNPASQAAATNTLCSPTRQLLGSEQLAWLQGQLTASQATWQVLGRRLNGSKVGEEFATQSVSSPGLEAFLSTLPPAQIKGIFEGVVDDLKWMDASRRGFLKMTFTPTQAKGEWVFIDKINSRSYAVLPSATSETRIFTA